MNKILYDDNNICPLSDKEYDHDNKYYSVINKIKNEYIKKTIKMCKLKRLPF